MLSFNMLFKIVLYFPLECGVAPQCFYVGGVILKGSFPLIAIANSQARCENFPSSTVFESTRSELASWLLQ